MSGVRIKPACRGQFDGMIMPQLATPGIFFDKTIAGLWSHCI
jgi:hypothetical protein